MIYHKKQNDITHKDTKKKETRNYLNKSESLLLINNLNLLF